MRGVTPKLSIKGDLRVKHYKDMRTTCQQQLELKKFKSWKAASLPRGSTSRRLGAGFLLEEQIDAAPQSFEVGGLVIDQA